MKRIAPMAFALSIALGEVAYTHGDEPHIRGTVVSTTGTTIVVKTTAGNNRTFVITADTKVVRGEARVTLKDIKVGERVVIHAMKHLDRVMASEIELAAAKPKQTK